MKVRQLFAEMTGPVQSVAPEDMVHDVVKFLQEKKRRSDGSWSAGRVEESSAY
jgi:hypothetical protein